MSKLFNFKRWEKANEKPLNESLASLVSLYSMHSPSGGETAVLAFIEQRLVSLGIDYEKDEYGQIYHVSAGQPLLCAHTDQVQKSSPPKSKILLVDGVISAPNFGLGADDKNGVWLILKILADAARNAHTLPSFIFSVQEEQISGRAAECFKAHFLDPETEMPLVPFALVLDRRNGGDIIGYQNRYCSKEFEDKVAEMGEHFGYRPTSGAYSDANGLSRFVNSVNLSVGYYNPHSTSEMTILKELENAGAFVVHLLENARELADIPFVAPKDIWDFDNDDYDYSDLWGRSKSKKKGNKNDNWKVRFDNVFLTGEEREYLGTLLRERLYTVEQRLGEYWEGNVEENDDKFEKLEEEYATIETILDELGQ